MTITNTVSVSEARSNFTRIGKMVSETRKPVTVFKGSTPYLVISPAPLADEPNEDTLAAFRELEETRADPSVKKYKSEEELFAALGL